MPLVCPLNDPDLVAREYASLDRLERRRLDSTGWLRGLEPLETLLSAIREVHPFRVLDAGCGAGGLAALLTAPEIVCVDQSEAALAAARARGLDARRADIQELPFADESFDVVMSNWTLYHLPDLERGVGEIARVIRLGGRFVGAYNRSGHLDELWNAVGHEWPPSTFDGDNGAEILRSHFSSVERRDTEGEVMWVSRYDLAAYLDAHGEIAGQLDAPEGPYPFRASRRNCVFVASK